MGKTHACASCRDVLTVFILMAVAACADAQTSTQTAQPSSTPKHVRGQDEPTKADLLRGAYGPYRANNDLLFYHLDIRIDPAKKFVSGKNTIRFKML